jgi:hypothetical protein
MSQYPAVEPADRVGHLEEETKRLAAMLKTATNQISVLQMILLLAAMGLFGGGYYLITTGKLRIEGLSPAVAQTVEAKEFGFFNRAGTRVMFDADDKFGNPQIIFLDDKKRLRMRLKVWPDGGGSAGVALYDHTGWRGMFRMDGATDGEMDAVLSLKGKGQTGGIDMTVAADGTPSLKLTDKVGTVLWEAPTKSK